MSLEPFEVDGIRYVHPWSPEADRAADRGQPIPTVDAARPMFELRDMHPRECARCRPTPGWFTGARQFDDLRSGNKEWKGLEWDPTLRF